MNTWSSLSKNTTVQFAVFGRIRRGVAPKHIGSCVLLLVSGTKFLVTAGHVTDLAKQTTLYVAGTEELVSLTFDAGFTTNPGVPRNDDIYDLSVCALSDAMQKQLGDVRYITEKEMYKGVPLGPSRIRMAMGYPTSKNKKGIDNPSKYIGGTIWIYASLAMNDADVAATLGIPIGDNVFVQFNHEESFDVDGVGTHSITPTGASGGAMFDLGMLDNPERLAEPARCEAKLLGILTEYRSRDKLIMATRMKRVLDICEHTLSVRRV